MCGPGRRCHGASLSIQVLNFDSVDISALISCASAVSMSTLLELLLTVQQRMGSMDPSSLSCLHNTFFVTQQSLSNAPESA